MFPVTGLPSNFASSQEEDFTQIGNGNLTHKHTISNRPNKRDQDLRAMYGLFNGNFNADRKAREVNL